MKYILQNVGLKRITVCVLSNTSKLDLKRIKNQLWKCEQHSNARNGK